ncbi:MAG: TonB-dependent receptor [Emcibacter sp.]|nr:TonB-dependent receptor [Emcibacter sp.]
MKMHTKKMLGSACSAALTFCVLTQAIATANANENNDFALEEIVVTASKTGAQGLQSTAIAVSVIGGSLMEEQGLHNIKDLASYVPGLTFGRNIATAIIYMRGIGSNGGSDPSVTTQVDGVYIARATGQMSDFLDVERIEVLRGPQGTLYGRNATGGTINIISRQPSSEFEGKIGLAYGNYNTFEGGAYLTGPLSGDKLTASLALNYRSHDAYFENIAPAGHDIATGNSGGGRLQVRWEPTENIVATTRADYAEVDEHIESYSHLVAALPFSAPLANSLVGSFSDVALDGDQTLESWIGGVSEEINWQINDDLTLNSTTAWRRTKTRAFNDNDASELDLLYFRSTGDTTQFSQEVNLQYVGDRIRGVVGAFYLHDKDTPGSRVAIPPSVITPVHRAAIRGAFPTLKSNSFAIYAQGDYEILEDLRLILGGRYTTEKKTIDQSFEATSLNPASLGAVPPGFPITFFTERKDEAFTPKIGLDYQATEDVFLYASATKGFKSGGFNGQARSAESAGFAPEVIWSYEVGAKTEWFDDRLRVNVTGFYYNYEDLQVRQLLGPGNSVISNAASATIKGFELEAVARPTVDIQITTVLSYLNARYENFPTASIPGGFSPYVSNQNCAGGVCTIDASGNLLNGAPKWSGMVAFDYTPQVGEYDLRVHLDYAFRSRTYFDASNITESSQEAYGLINANLGFGSSEDGGWQFEVFGKNLANRGYYQIVAGNGPAPGAIVGDPRTFGVRVRMGW